MKNGATANYLNLLLVEQLNLLRLSCSLVEMQNFLISRKDDLILGIILPFLFADSSEVALLLGQPEEYINFMIDTIEEKQSGVLKTSASNLLQTVCDYLDGFTTYISQLSIIILSVSL